MQGELCSRLEVLIYISLTCCCLLPGLLRAWVLGGERRRRELEDGFTGIYLIRR